MGRSHVPAGRPLRVRTQTSTARPHRLRHPFRDWPLATHSHAAKAQPKRIMILLRKTTRRPVQLDLLQLENVAADNDRQRVLEQPPLRRRGARGQGTTGRPCAS
jgi:hypothetical protein